MIRLYEHPLSPYAQKVKISLYEKGIPFESTIPNIFGEDAEFDRANPRREVPALEDGGTCIFDSTIILEYLDEKVPEPKLIPDSPAERARVRMIEDVCDTYVEAINWGMYEIRFFGRASGALAETLTKRASEQWSGVHSWLERELGDREWFDGARFGRGDLSVFPYVGAAASLGMAPLAGSKLARWLARAGARESTKKCVEAATASLAGFEEIPKLVQQGVFVRQYRDHRLEWMFRSGGESIVREGVAKKNIHFAVEVK
jgi:glutathione S-transferase